jgi:hypothetical protein
MDFMRNRTKSAINEAIHGLSQRGGNSLRPLLGLHSRSIHAEPFSLGHSWPVAEGRQFIAPAPRVAQSFNSRRTILPWPFMACRIGAAIHRARSLGCMAVRITQNGRVTQAIDHTIQVHDAHSRESAQFIARGGRPRDKSPVWLRPRDLPPVRDARANDRPFGYIRAINGPFDHTQANDRPV